MHKNLLYLLFAILLAGCQLPAENPAIDHLKEGHWRGVLNLQGNEAPFNFTVTYEDSVPIITLQNAAERLKLDEITWQDDSVLIKMHIFDAAIKAKLTAEEMHGYWIKYYDEGYIVPFEATHGSRERFIDPDAVAKTAFDGKWQTIFIHEGDTTEAVGIFRQTDQGLSGTFLTPTGDYRYLQGSATNDKLYLSTFDGGHGFLFTASLNGDSLKGDFWSGVRWHESWIAVRRDNASLPDADSITYIKEGYDGIDFSFPDLNGDMVSPGDDRFKGKVTVLQIFGTWCPNCMDETRFLSAWYEKNKSRGVEILGIAYEAKDDFDYAKNRVNIMKERLNVGYDFVIGGTKEKDEAAKTLPMLNHVLSFPTTIFLDKKGEVRRIHTGFTGPGTGPYYEQFVKEFDETIELLLQENP